jgi:hypothetical protein
MNSILLTFEKLKRVIPILQVTASLCNCGTPLFIQILSTIILDVKLQTECCIQLTYRNILISIDDKPLQSAYIRCLQLVVSVREEVSICRNSISSDVKLEMHLRRFDFEAVFLAFRGEFLPVSC